MKILKLEAANVKRLKAVVIEPKGNTVTITGKNDQGKTSILDAIEYALGGNSAICERPVRLGEKKARIVVNLGDIIVERRFTEAGGTSLEVRDAEGVPQRSPQAILDALCQHLAFDPLSFTRLKPAAQRDLLCKLTGLDFTELNAARQRVYDERTLEGQKLTSAKGRITGFPFDPTAPAAPVSAAALTQRLAEVKQKNLAVNAAEQRIEQMERRVATLTKEWHGLGEDIHQLKRQLAAKEQLFESKQKEINTAAMEVHEAKASAAAMERADEFTVQTEIDDIEATNQKVRANQRHQEVQAEIDASGEQVKHLTAELEKLDLMKQTKIQNAKFPLPGLSIDETGVLLNGVPFSQGSQAKQLQAAIAIGLALNPKVRVILIRDASLLDDDSMKLVADLAEKHDAQVWLEVVSSKDPTAVMIEDGQVKEAVTF